MVSNILNKVRSVIALVMQKSSLILRMILKFVCFYLLFKNISSMSYFSGTGLFNDNAIQLILAAVATVLPNRSGILIALAIVIYNVYQTSVVGAIIVGLLLILLYIITSSLFPEYT
ncbi:MAG: hypothetical protein J6P72_02545, partial [Firmicutes bacterium]|nr:hypothetical protein [Bacillota bacterium]